MRVSLSPFGEALIGLFEDEARRIELAGLVDDKQKYDKRSGALHVDGVNVR
ncbi:hypothetical protein ACIQUM_32865 [Amycolatopsis azurea]|uniref:hypothetical protein n=1 Tax=Amycolatopsis azurea TaxID=36819 RepID=UPI003813F006